MVDLTADIILTKLENLVKWVCLIPFLTEMLKNHLPALCSLFFAILIIQLSSKLVSLPPSEIFPFPFLLIFIGTLLCKVVLVSGVQQSKSGVCVCIPSFSDFLLIQVHRGLIRIPYKCESGSVMSDS